MSGLGDREGEWEVTPDWTEAWEVDRGLLGVSFEEVVEKGQTERDCPEGEKDKTLRQIQIYNCPAWIGSIIKHTLCNVHETLVSPSAVTRFLLKKGVVHIQEMYIPALAEKKTEIVRAGHPMMNLMDTIPFSPIASARPFNAAGIDMRLISRAGRMSAWSFWWTDSVLGHQAATLGLSKSTVAIVAILYALASSENWVPLWARELAVSETTHFEEWVNQLMKTVMGM